MSFNIFSGMTAYIVSGLIGATIGATIAFALRHLGLPKPKNWEDIGYKVGAGTMKKPKRIPPECLDVFYQGKDYGSRVRPLPRWCLSCGLKLGGDCGRAEPDFNHFYCSKGCYQTRKKKIARRNR